MGSKFSVARMRKELAAQTMTTVTTSGDVLAGGFSLYDVGTLAASGSTQATAATIVNHVTMVTAADGTKGVVLPLAVTNGEFYAIGNAVANQALKLYPSTGSYFNGLGQNIAVSLTGSQGALCVYASSSIGDKWAVVWGGAS